jgi:hypothetical protein
MAWGISLYLPKRKRRISVRNGRKLHVVSLSTSALLASYTVFGLPELPGMLQRGMSRFSALCNAALGDCRVSNGRLPSRQGREGLPHCDRWLRIYSKSPWAGLWEMAKTVWGKSNETSVLIDRPSFVLGLSFAGGSCKE